MPQEELDGSADAAGDLAFIRRIMEESRRQARDNGVYYLLWGGLVIVCTPVSYLLGFAGQGRFVPWFWGAAFSGMGIFLAIGAARSRGKGGTLGNFLLGAVWGSVLLLMAALVGASALAGRLDLPWAMGLSSLGIGLGYLLSAAVGRSPLILALALPWWIGGLIIPLLPPLHAPAALAGLTLLFEFIPGLAMYLRWRAARRRADGD